MEEHILSRGSRVLQDDRGSQRVPPHSTLHVPSSWPAYLAEHRFIDGWNSSEDHPPTQIAERLASLLPALPASQLQAASAEQSVILREVWEASQSPEEHAPHSLQCSKP